MKLLIIFMCAFAISDSIELELRNYELIRFLS